MSKFRIIVLKALKEAEETRKINMIYKNKMSRLSAGVISLCLLFAQPIEAKTNRVALHNDHEITAKYEHGGKGYQAIGKDSYGGYSYGKWQISTERRKGKPSTFDFFLRYAQETSPKYYKILEKAGGQKAAYIGSQNFILTWKKLAAEKAFQRLYDNFLLHKQIIPVYERLDESKNPNLDLVTTWGSTDNAIQAAIKSSVVQHGSGGAFGMIRNVVEIYKPTTKEMFLKRLYEYRTNRFPRYKSRYKAEYSDLCKYLNSGTSKIVLKKETNLASLIRKIKELV